MPIYRANTSTFHTSPLTTEREIRESSRLKNDVVQYAVIVIVSPLLSCSFFRFDVVPNSDGKDSSALRPSQNRLSVCHLLSLRSEGCGTAGHEIVTQARQ